MKKLVLFFAMLAVMTLTACSNKSDADAEKKSDAETEKKIAGTWIIEYNETDEDDIVCHGYEEITYDAENHTLVSNGSFYYSYYGESLGSITFKANGTWKATKDELIETFNTDNMMINLSHDFLENSGMSEQELRKEFINDLKDDKVSKIKSLTDNEIIIIDPDGEKLTYSKK